MHRDIEGYNDDFDDVVDYLLDDGNLLDNEDTETIVTIQLMLASFIERIYNLQRELSRVRRTKEESLVPGDIYYPKDHQAMLDALCQEFEAKATVLYKFVQHISVAPCTLAGTIEMAAKDWKALLRELHQGVSREYLIFPRR
ncbi:hypothetical protein CHU98_g10531 [Xylaria longipes]|nr:hypothetical protein CHU98_g10531 [Xylaria longipes]